MCVCGFVCVHACVCVCVSVRAVNVVCCVCGVCACLVYTIQILCCLGVRLVVCGVT